jgi:putative colanic acid biosynthesis acetyltransferase WcaB|tara:strand:+ start:593 stop:1093 length:501 start_codon:yes stop_codon:yes gene_type:complete
MIKYLIQDWNANFSSSKGRFIMLNYRIASYINKRKFLKLMFFPYLILHRIFFDWILGVEININAKIGSGFRLFHGQGLVINGDSIVGNNCLFRNGITLGTKLNQNGELSKAPILGHNVCVGSNTVIIGEVTIGNNVVIGAGSVVVKSFPSNTVIAGNPAKIIKRLS